MVRQVLDVLEPRVNQLEIEIEEKVLGLIARRQPAAGDLRLLVALLKINNDLERIGDQACNFSGTVLYLLREAPLTLPQMDIPGMAKIVQKMVRDSIHAFVHHDPELAMAVCEADDLADDFKDKLFHLLLEHMMQEPKAISRCVDYILISRNLERIADHATNISEEVIFIENGKNIKHRGQEESLLGN
jgi:phosphate transport system protein